MTRDNGVIVFIFIFVFVFVFANGAQSTGSVFTAPVHTMLSASTKGNWDMYAGHVVRIDAKTTAAIAGLPDRVIRAARR